MWLACYTQEEIADAVGCHPTDKVLRVSGNLEDLPKNQQSLATHATDFDMWLACHTQEEIAEAVGVPVGTIGREILQFGKVADLKKSEQSLATHATDFEPKRSRKNLAYPVLHAGRDCGGGGCGEKHSSERCCPIRQTCQSGQTRAIPRRGGI